MGNMFSNIFGNLFGKKEFRILMLGLNNAGKTSILFKMNLGEFIQVAPTTAFNVETVDYNNIKFQIWDLAGQKGIRPYWKSYYPDTQAIIFVIDSTDQARMKVAKEEFLMLLEQEELANVPVLILANKQDLPNASQEAEITQLLGLTTLKARAWALHKTSAVTGDGIKEGMDWLSTTLENSDQ